MYHIFFIHSSVDGHLGFFLVLAIVNSAEKLDLDMSFKNPRGRKEVTVLFWIRNAQSFLFNVTSQGWLHFIG